MSEIIGLGEDAFQLWVHLVATLMLLHGQNHGHIPQQFLWRGEAEKMEARVKRAQGNSHSSVNLWKIRSWPGHVHTHNG